MNLCLRVTICWVPAISLLAVPASALSARAQQPLAPASPPAYEPISVVALPSSEAEVANGFQTPTRRRAPTEIALDGYCVVSLHDQEKWVEGKHSARAVFGDKLYLFASVRERDIFTASPEKYAPALNGDCIVTYAQSGTRVPGDLQQGVMFQDRLFFFANREKLDQFQRSPQHYLTADLVDQGYCVVSKIDDHKLVPGIPETVAILDGLRYFFANAFKRKIFAANPSRYGASVTSHIRATQLASSPTISSTDPLSKSNESTTSTSNRSEAEENAAEKELKLDSRPVMSGYCPVTIRTRGIWVRGKSKFKELFDGRIYYLAGAEELTVFQQNPLAYVPVLGGDSIVSFVDRLQRVPGSVFHPLIAGERLFLFVDQEEKQKFIDNVELYENADLAFNGNCMVTQVEKKQETPGLKQFETVHHGKRYRFASQQNLEKFLENPEKFEEE